MNAITNGHAVDADGAVLCTKGHGGRPCGNARRLRFIEPGECAQCWTRIHSPDELFSMFSKQAFARSKEHVIADTLRDVATALKTIAEVQRDQAGLIAKLAKFHTGRPKSMRLETDADGVRRAVPEYD